VSRPNLTSFRIGFDASLSVISRLQRVHIVVKDISDHSKEMSSSYDASLESFTPHFQKLSDLFPREFDKYRLDEVVVAAVTPFVNATFYYNVKSVFIKKKLFRFGDGLLSGSRLKILVPSPLHFEHGNER